MASQRRNVHLHILQLQHKPGRMWGLWGCGGGVTAVWCMMCEVGSECGVDGLNWRAVRCVMHGVGCGWWDAVFTAELVDCPVCDAWCGVWMVGCGVDGLN
eukprot:364311-Chlamydomonas_euryale.AAC.7